MHTAVCDWLMDHADAPIRYRTARELLNDPRTAQELESELLEHKAVSLWLANLKPVLPQQHSWLEHGSFDVCLENALLKAVQLGLHGGLAPVRDAVSFYGWKTQRYAELPRKRRNFTAILTANLLSLAGMEDDAVYRCMTDSLHEMSDFTRIGYSGLYLKNEERAKLTGVPACWKDRERFIGQELLEAYGFAYPLIYDIAGLHSLYRLRDPEIDRQIDAVLRMIATDGFHQTVEDGYGILSEGNGVYHGMGWDPKFPGWFSPEACVRAGGAQKLLFFAQYACRYPAARDTRWYRELLGLLDGFRTREGRFAFPAAWLKETKGYAVMGYHLSYGENRRKPDWAEIESTFYMQLLLSAAEG